LRDGRHRTKDRLAAPARLQPEQRAAIVDEVELDVTTAAPRLEITLALGPRLVAMAHDDRRIRFEEGVAHRSCQRETGHEAAFVEVIEEDAADAARLVAVLQEEVIVAPALEARVPVGTERLER